MRGKVPERICDFVRIRITPAYVGKRRHLHRSRFPDRDHPRLCGEKNPLKDVFQVGLGSPPPMRGKAVFPLICVSAMRITPAYAGKS